MNWTTLFSMQRKLDDHIKTKHNLVHESLLEKKYLALLVELGELANETRCFKFWSTKAANDRSLILEEYVDGIHFLLSIGLELGFHYDESIIKDCLLSITEQFVEVFDKCIVFKNEPTQTTYENMFTSYLQLGYLLGFDETDIQKAYMKKNQVNFKRQHEGY